MEKILVDKVLKKQFIELSTIEREELKEWCSSEEEFDQLKMVFKGVERYKASETLLPKAETKRSLDDLFAQQQAKIAPVIWYNSILVSVYPKDKPMVQRPLVQIAAIALVLLMVYPFLFKEQFSGQKQQLAQVEKESNDVPKPAKDVQEEAMQQPSEIVNEPIAFTTVESDEMPFASDFEDAAMSSGEVSLADKDVEFTNAPAMSTHPDGIFIGTSTVSYSQPASAQPAIFDLLTTTF